MKEIETHGYELASKGTRLIATITEAIIYTLALLIIYLLLGKSFSVFWADFNKDLAMLDVVYSLLTGLAIGAVFYPLFTGNLGHRIFNLKVISADNGKDFKKPLRGAARESLKYVLGYVFIPVIWLLWDDKNQNLYDKITKTLVVKKGLDG